MVRKTASRGFTIVELLIVVVVIAVLAAISAVAYTNIQNRTHNSVVQNDITSYGKKIQLFYVDNGRYPHTVSELNAATGISSSNSYEAHNNALHYCYSTVDGTMAIGGVSKSGRGFIFKDGTIKEVSGWPNTGAVAICTGANWFDLPMPSGSRTTWRTPSNVSWSGTHMVP